ncbi:SH3 domain-containing protein [Leptospira meyeri]|uniref:SH3 domain-containing protein n=1 Tax=Leptospira meyeri TaxID=29508 RepID=UPI001083A1B5|nr:SH3 domain-containing protein [Leptospira meyeri]TGL51164.1 SH3 domain-containing protein [Leptospira meyeri]
MLVPIRLKRNIILSAVVLALISCSSFPIGSGYTSKPNTIVYSKPDDKSTIVSELKKDSHFNIITYNYFKSNQKGKLWHKIKQENVVGYIEENVGDNSNSPTQLFLTTNEPIYGFVVASSLVLRSQPNTTSAAIEKLATKEIVSVIEEGKNSVIVNGKTGSWAKVKTKNNNVGFVFTPYLMLSKSPDNFVIGEDIESKEKGWVYTTTFPNTVYIKKHGKLYPVENDQVSENDFYLLDSRYITKDGKVFFHIYKQTGRKADWYSEIEVEYSTDCYISSNHVKVSDRYAVLYSQFKESDKKKRKLIEFLDQQSGEEIDPAKSDFYTFISKKEKYHVIITSTKSEFEDCRDCFYGDDYNLVFVFHEKDNQFKKIFSAGGSRSASFGETNKNFYITIATSPLPEGDESPSTIKSSKYKFNGTNFDLESEEKN